MVTLEKIVLAMAGKISRDDGDTLDSPESEKGIDGGRSATGGDDDIWSVAPLSIVEWLIREILSRFR